MNAVVDSLDGATEEGDGPGSLPDRALDRGGRVYFPSGEEMRMVRAIALLALMEAARHGAYRARFRRFCVEAHREPGATGGAASVHVHLCVSLDDGMLERGVVSACAMPVVEGDTAGRVRRWSSD